jgi:hypothetical protein
MPKLLFSFLLIPVITLSLSLPAQARQWVKVGEGWGSAQDVFVDVDSIKGIKSTRRFWSKTIYKTDQTFGSRSYRSTISKSWVNCETEKIGISHVTYYNENGEVIYSSLEKDEPEKWRAILPDTLGEAQLNVVCKLKTNKSDSDNQAKQPDSSTSGQGRAKYLIEKWLKAKSKIFGPSRDKSLTAKITTGKLYRELAGRNGELDWLKDNGAFYEYGVQKVDLIKQYSESSTKMVVQAYVIENSRLFKGDVVIKSSGGSERLLVKYEFIKADGFWKLENYQVLEMQEIAGAD